MPSEIKLTLGLVKADGTKYASSGCAPDIVLSYRDYAGVTPSQFDRAVDRMVEDGMVVEIG